MNLRILLSLFIVAAPLCGQTTMRQIDLSRFFNGLPATFVLLDGRSGEMQAHDTLRATTRFIPASTFKIPHTLVILETGVGKDAGFSIPWDSVANPARSWWPATWRGDQTLRTAFRNSVVWFYQATARRIGPETMQAYVTKFRYGNENIGGGIDRFWLDGDLRISAVEQADFLRRVFTGEVPVSERSRAILKEIMLLDSSDARRIYGKTGTANTESGVLAWLVGFVESGTEVYYYALNIEGESAGRDWPPQKRLSLVQHILRELLIGEKE